MSVFEPMMSAFRAWMGRLQGDEECFHRDEECFPGEDEHFTGADER